MALLIPIADVEEPVWTWNLIHSLLWHPSFLENIFIEIDSWTKLYFSNSSVVLYTATFLDYCNVPVSHEDDNPTGHLVHMRGGGGLDAFLQSRIQLRERLSQEDPKFKAHLGYRVERKPI